MAAFQRRGNAWWAQVRERGHAPGATSDTPDEARAWTAARKAKLLAGAEAEDGRAAFLTPADLFRRYRDEASPKKRGPRPSAPPNRRSPSRLSIGPAPVPPIGAQ